MTDKEQIPDTELERLAKPADVTMPPFNWSDDAPELTVIPQEEREVEDRPAPSWMNLNPLFRGIALAQPLEVGSWEWMQAGMAARSGDSGEQSSYGWRFTHRLNDAYRRAVISNYAARPVYYLNAPYRQFPYEICGRPHGWVPEDAGDHPNGYSIYNSSRGQIRVSGPDAEHYWLTPLFALTDDKAPTLIDTGLGWQMSSRDVAIVMGKLLVSAAVGAVRDRNGDGVSCYPWTYGGRATFRLLHTIIEGLRRGLLLDQDVPTAAAYIGGIVLPFLERAPGTHSFGAGRPGQFPMGLFNDFFWTVPACYDAAQVLGARSETKEWAKRFHAIVERFGQWAIDMNAISGGHCWHGDRVFLKNEFMKGTDEGKPVDSIAPFINEDDFHYTFPFADWGFRCLDICAEVTGSNTLAESRDMIRERFANTSKKQWLVYADGEYAT